MNINKALICGRLTRNPELRTTAGGTAVATFALATNHVTKDKAGEKKESVQFHNCVAFGKTAEVISQFAMKGQELFVEGRIEREPGKRRTARKKARRR